MNYDTPMIIELRLMFDYLIMDDLRYRLNKLCFSLDFNAGIIIIISPGLH